MRAEKSPYRALSQHRESAGRAPTFVQQPAAKKTYFQKISRKEDIAPTTAVAFTINHIGAVFLPVILGYLWILEPEKVFFFASGLAILSLFFSFMVPSNPSLNNPTVFSKN